MDWRLIDQVSRFVSDRVGGTPDARLRVMQVITHLDMGGAEGIAMTLIESLRASVDFTLFAVLDEGVPSAVGQDMARRLADWNVPVRVGTRRGFKSGGALLAALAIARAVRRDRPDIVHLHTEIPELAYAIACLLSRRVRRTPLLRTVHNCTLWIAWGGIGRWVTGRLAHGTAIAVSENAAHADAAIPTGSVRPRAQVIYNGVRQPAVAAPDAACADDPVRILFAGRLVEQKGADLLPAILAAAHAHAPDRPVDITIAGSGAMQGDVAQGLADALPGWTVAMVPPMEQLADRLHRYDAVLLPSRYEGFGLLALETLMAGVPLVTTDAPGLDEVVPPDYPLRAGVDDVATLGRHLAAVIADPAAHRPVAALFGARLATRFSPDAMAQAYRARYDALARRGAANRGVG